MSNIELPQNKNYKGRIHWLKSQEYNKFAVIKRRGFRNDIHRISKEEFDYIDNARKAEKIWAYHHFGVNCRVLVKGD